MFLRRRYFGGGGRGGGGGGGRRGGGNPNDFTNPVVSSGGVIGGDIPVRYLSNPEWVVRSEEWVVSSII